jgi:branched-chain amino acid transport system ATP-binding protein
LVEILRVERLTKNFGGLAAVNNLSFTISQGEIVGIIGPNGSGKTTVFNLITGVYKPTSGRILYKDENIGGKRPHEIFEKGVGRTFQIVKSFNNLTVLDNVTVGALTGRTLSEARTKALDVLKFTGLFDRRFNLARSLTLEDRKRLEVARAIASEPELLLLDEVMAGLNPKEIENALELIREIRRKGITLVVVDHVMKALMPISERVIVLDHGEKIAEGSPAEISRMETVIVAYLGRGLTFAKGR